MLISALIGGCHDSSTLPVVSMQIGNRTFHIEIATSIEARMTGLMKRDSMPDDHGMIFVFDTDVEHGFYMKNTRFPLDIVFIDNTGVVVSIKQMKPYDESSTYSDKPYRYAIELNEGAAAGAGLKVGDKLTIPPEAKSK